MQASLGEPAAGAADPHVSLGAVPGARAPSRIVSSLVSMAENAAAAVLAVEVLLLTATVILRYVFNRPLTWSDEIAEILIIWQAMLGAAVGLYRNEHMGLGAIAQRLAAPVRERVGLACMVLVLAFTVVIGYYAVHHAWAELPMLTPALSISASWRSSAIAVGLALMAVIAAAQLRAGTQGRLRALLQATSVLVIVALALYLTRGAFGALGNLNLVIFFVGIGGACLVMGLPIAFAFGVATIAYVLCATHAPLGIVVTRMESGMSHVLLLSVPLFIILGSVLEIAGMARTLVSFLASLVGHVKGGLSYVLVGAMLLVSGISGSKAADMGAIAPVLLPEMKRRGAKEGELIALLAASSALSETVPPSLILIMAGAVVGVSIGALFSAGWLPALLLGVMVCVAARIRARHTDLSRVVRAPWREVARIGVQALPVLALPFLIRSAVVEGVATATEVATIGIAYVIVVSLLLSRSFDWKAMFNALKSASVLTGSIFLILATANAMSWGFVQSGLSGVLFEAANSLPGGAVAFMVVSILVFIVFGSVLEGIPAIVLLGPLVFPIAKAFGISEVHYAIVAVLSMGIGLFAPPFGVGYYTACAIGRIEPSVPMKDIWMYLLVVLAGVVFIAFSPWITVGWR
ncbi:MAG TPA: TRAP transporter large permease subunit [Ramlibacter sp.]|nr:TRAP transporter large permease subunit [Ramlibacter sp.]